MGRRQGDRAMAFGQPTPSVAGLNCGPDRGRAGLSGKPMVHSHRHHTPFPQPLSKGRKPKALTQKTQACLPLPIIQSPWRQVALSPGWADR